MYSYFNLLSGIADTVSHDSALTGYLNTFSPALSTRFQIGIDTADPLTPEDGPVINLIPFDSPTDSGAGQIQLGMENTVQTPAFGIEWWIYDKNKVSVGNFTYLRGLSTADEIGRRIVDALSGYSDTVGHQIEYLDYQISPLIEYPVFAGMVIFSLRGEVTLAGPAFEA